GGGGERAGGLVRWLRGGGRGGGGKPRSRALADQREGDIDHPDRLRGGMGGVAVLVERIEGGADAGAISRRYRLDAHRNLQREFLPHIAQVEMDLPLCLCGVA